LGQVEAADESEATAMEKAADEFKVAAKEADGETAMKRRSQDF
jgi:hypothetical protein